MPLVCSFLSIYSKIKWSDSVLFEVGDDRVKKLTIALVAGIAITLLSCARAEANQSSYLRGDPSFPMVQKVGQTENVGLYLSLGSINIEDVFEDGLEASAGLVYVTDRKEELKSTILVRFGEDDKAWAKGMDGKWREISASSDDPAALVVSYIKREMGKSSKRDVFADEMEQVINKKKGNLGKVEPKDAKELVMTPKKADKEEKNLSVKKKGNVPTEKDLGKNKEGNQDVTVVITETPTVEITKNPPAQVDIT